MREALRRLGAGPLNRRWRVRRWYNRAMLLLWRLGLWRPFDPLYLILTTFGRKTRTARYTVVWFRAAGGRRYVLALWGIESDWYRNVLADPHVTVHTAHGVERAIATHVTDEQELRAVYESFGPPLRAAIDWYLRSRGLAPSPADILAQPGRVAALRLDPTDEPTPPPLPADLTWVLPLALAGLVGLVAIWRVGNTMMRHAVRRKG